MPATTNHNFYCKNVPCTQYVGRPCSHSYHVSCLGEIFGTKLRVTTTCALLSGLSIVPTGRRGDGHPPNVRWDPAPVLLHFLYTYSPGRIRQRLAAETSTFRKVLYGRRLVSSRR